MAEKHAQKRRRTVAGWKIIIGEQNYGRLLELFKDDERALQRTMNWMEPLIKDCCEKGTDPKKMNRKINLALSHELDFELPKSTGYWIAFWLVPAFGIASHGFANWASGRTAEAGKFIHMYRGLTNQMCNFYENERKKKTVPQKKK